MKKLLAIISVLSVIAVLNAVDPARPFSAPEVAIRGVASWYSTADPGILKTTANMEVFDDRQLTCAMWDVPFNTLIRVTNPVNGKTVVVRVNDRGPAKRLVEKGRIIDLTKKAFSEIADPDKGLIAIEVSILPD